MVCLDDSRKGIVAKGAYHGPFRCLELRSDTHPSLIRLVNAFTKRR
jgi:hypothetical protein